MKQNNYSRTLSLVLILLYNYNLLLIVAFWLIMIYGKSTYNLLLIALAAILGIAGWLFAHLAARQAGNQEDQKPQTRLFKAIRYSSWLVYATIAVCVLKLLVNK